MTSLTDNTSWKKVQTCVRLFVGLEVDFISGVKVAEFAVEGSRIFSVIGGNVVLNVGCNESKINIKSESILRNFFLR